VTHFTELVDLLSERVGGSAIDCNDEFFAPKENLVRASEPVFLEGKYTERGKWMDGWETRRRRTPGHDWCILRLGLPGVIRGFIVDTRHFKGNYPESCSIEGCAHLTESPEWEEILRESALRGDAENCFDVDSPRRVTHLRLRIFPDGGVARLRAYGDVIPDPKRLAAGREVDLAAIENGALVTSASDTFFGSPSKLILPGSATHMGDGWETRRRRGPGNDWCVIKLATEGAVRRVDVDTSHFKGNFPESCSLEACVALMWTDILPRVKLEPDTRHVFEDELLDAGPATHVRFHIYPDGGIARLRVFGTTTSEGRWQAGLRRFNALFPGEAQDELLRCCGLHRWAQAVIERRPYETPAALRDAADRVWGSLDRDDWLEAFRAHPKIGERGAAKWSQQEQSGAKAASRETLDALAQVNQEYEARFGYIFIVCATGKSAEEMLAIARARLANHPDTELRAAAEEQRRIMQLRLEKLLAS
jgi:allantoicase